MSKALILPSVRHFFYMGRIFRKMEVVDLGPKEGKERNICLFNCVSLICAPCLVETSEARTKVQAKGNSCLLMAPKFLIQNASVVASFSFQSSNSRPPERSRRIDAQWGAVERIPDSLT